MLAIWTKLLTCLHLLKQSSENSVVYRCRAETLFPAKVSAVVRKSVHAFVRHSSPLLFEPWSTSKGSFEALTGNYARLWPSKDDLHCTTQRFKVKLVGGSKWIAVEVCKFWVDLAKQHSSQSGPATFLGSGATNFLHDTPLALASCNSYFCILTSFSWLSWRWIVAGKACQTRLWEQLGWAMSASGPGAL